MDIQWNHQNISVVWGKKLTSCCKLYEELKKTPGFWYWKCHANVSNCVFMWCMLLHRDEQMQMQAFVDLNHHSLWTHFCRIPVSSITQFFFFLQKFLPSLSLQHPSPISSRTHMSSAETAAPCPHPSTLVSHWEKKTSPWASGPVKVRLCCSTSTLYTESTWSCSSINTVIGLVWHNLSRLHTNKALSASTEPLLQMFFLFPSCLDVFPVSLHCLCL